MRPRQRLRAERSPLRWLGRVPLVLLALAFVWYGVIACLLATKVAPGTVQAISGYRTAYRVLNGVGAGDITGLTRLITGLSGFAAFLACSFLAWKTIARPHLARSSWQVPGEARGVTVVEPRAIERAAEAAAREHPGVEGVAGRYEGDGLVLSVELGRARDAADALAEVQRRARAALTRHGLPLVPVEVRLNGFDTDRGRELA